jgi:uncharacterized protein YndB with AHSA1/START domain
MPDTALPDTTLEITRTFNAPRARVFAAWMDPDAMRRWYRMADAWSTSVAEVDLRVGGRYRIGMQPPGHDRFFEEGEFREIVVDERLVYTNVLQAGTEADHDGVVVTVTFRDADAGGCEVTVREEGFPSARVRDVHASGWPGFLDQLGAHLTTR